MPDDLYERDILAWSEHQAALLRRVAAGERVNALDWPHVIEEIESVGESELRACRSLLRQALLHLLKLHGWPASPACAHWRGEAAVFLLDAADAFAPSMRQRLDLPALYDQARGVAGGMALDGVPPGPFPAICPFVLDDLLAMPPDVAALLNRLAAGGAG